MKKLACISLLAVALLLVASAPSDAWVRHGGFRTHVWVGVGPSWYWGPPWWYYPPYYVYSPPPVVVQQPPVYIQQSPPAPPPPPAPPAASQPYWYYCPSAQAYYPNVQTCPEPWVKVPPRTE